MSKLSDKIKKNILALDIGTGGIKIVVGDVNREKLYIKKIAYAPFVEGLVNNGEITDIKQLAQILKQALKQNKIKSKNCFCVYESNQIITREVTVPSPDRKAIFEMAKFELEQFAPVEMSDYLVQSRVLKEIVVDEKPFAEMLVTAFPRKSIDQLHQAISMAGLRPIVLDTQSNAFSKLIENQYKINGNDYHRDGAVAFIDIGKETVSVNIFQKGKFRLNRTLKVGGKDLDINIAKLLDISQEEAEQKKLQINNINYVVDETSESFKVNNVIKSTMSNWLDEIIKIFRYYAAKASGNRSIEYIFVYGGGSNINGLNDFLESYMKIPVEEVKSLSEVTFNIKKADISELLNAIGVMHRR